MDLSLRSIRKNIAALSVLAVMASMLVVTGIANAAATDYLDVNGGEWYEAPVDWGLDNGVLDATQVNFRPGDSASRAEFFTMVARGAAIPETACDELAFPDLTADHWGCGYVTALAQAGIVSGDDENAVIPGAVRPDDPINRAEAAKVIVEAFGLTGTTLGSDVFTDVPADSWYNSYMGIANENCVFRGVDNGNTVEPGRAINRAESVTVVQRGANPTTDCAPVVTAGALTVSLDGSTPDSLDVPQNGANILYSVFELSASADEDVNVEQLILTREGLGLPGDFDTVKLYVNGVQKGSEKTVNTSTNTATFSLAGDPIEVPAGSSVLVEVRADMAGAENSQNAFCIDMADDVLAYGADSAGEVSVGGSFAVCGNYMTTTSASVGTLTYEVDDYTGDMYVGDTDLSLARLNLEADTKEDIDVTRITYKQKGSADAEDFANMALYVSGSQIADSSVATWDGDFLTFDLSGDPLSIERGNSRTVELRGDIVGGLGNDVLFDIYRDWHIEGVGAVYGYGVNVTEVLTPPTLDTRDIKGGNLALALSSNNPTVGDVADGAEDHLLMAFNVSTGGDGVTFRSFDLDVNYSGASADVTELQDVKVWKKNSADEWVVVAGPLDPTGAFTNPYTLSFTDSWDQEAGTTEEYRVTADVDNNAPAGAVYSVDLDTATLDAEYLSNGDSVAAGDITGATLTGQDQTVAAPSIDVSLAASPGDQNIVAGKDDFDVAVWDFAASSASDLHVTSIAISCSYVDTIADGDTCADVFSNLALETRGSSITTLQSGKSFSGTQVVFNSVDFWIDAGDTVKVALVANTSNAADATDTAGFNVAAAGDITVEDSQYNSLGTAQITAEGGGFPGAARVITFVGTGTLTVEVSGDTPAGDALLQNTDGYVVSRIKFSADQNEDINISKLRLTDMDHTLDTNEYGETTTVGEDCDGDAASDYCSDEVATVYLYDGENELASTSLNTAGFATFTALDINVPADGSITLDVVVDTDSLGASLGESGHSFQLVLNDVDEGPLVDPDFDTNIDIKATGASSGKLLNYSTDNSIVDGNGYNGSGYYDTGADLIGHQIVYTTLPTLAITDTTPEGNGTGSTQDSLLEFDYTVDGPAGKDGAIQEIAYSLNGTGAGAVPASSVTLKEGSTVLAYDSDSSGVIGDVVGDWVTGSEISLEAGSSPRTLTIAADTSLVATDAKVGVSIAGFMYDDGSGTAGDAPYCAEATSTTGYCPFANGGYRHFDTDPMPLSGNTLNY